MHGQEDEQSAFTLLVRPFQRSLFVTACAQSRTMRHGKTEGHDFSRAGSDACVTGGFSRRD
jgi:hypothetical protein